MGYKTYKATEYWMTAARKLMGFELRVTGAENLPDRPTMFVSNHFTRIETFLTPYALFLKTRRQVRSLGMHGVFRGVFGKYFELLGAMSVRHPKRNLTIISQLMTGDEDWLIYPEGGLVKNKKMVENGRLQLQRADRVGPPHTGAAMMALKAEISKRRYLDACARGDEERIRFYEERFDLSGPDAICRDGIVIVPVNLTFYPLRPGFNLINRLARRFSRELSPKLEEELLVEGKILLGRAEVIIHFGDPIEVSDYLDRPTQYARKLVGMFSEMRGGELALRRQARRLTDASVRSIYSGTEINLDHLFSAGLYAIDREIVDAEDLHRALYLTASRLARGGKVRVHPSFHNGISSLVTGGPYWPLDSIVQFATEVGIVRREGAMYRINLEALHGKHDFHQIRLRNPIRVLANEMEPSDTAMRELRQALRLSPVKLRSATGRELVEADRRRFERDYLTWGGDDNPRLKQLGEPFFLHRPDNRVGVVLVHGYLGCPEQVRPLAEFLHERGLNVYGVRLAGHGTSPKQLPHVTWQGWMDSVMHGYAVIREHCDKVVVAGFSLGGILALLAAARQGREIDAAVSINAPLKLRDRRMPLVPALVRWGRVLRRVGLGAGHRPWKHATESPGINYDHHYLEAVSEVRRAVAAARKELKDVQCPALVIQAEEDPLVAQSSGRTILAELRSSEKVLTELPFQRHMIIRGPGSDLVHRKVAVFLERATRVEPDPVMRLAASESDRLPLRAGPVRSERAPS